ncbi:type II toxin-antitoxin system PemK/MazF family toxin [Thermococci archaeon]|nr:MAG: type II toxin-antitoxin system PemK/MazF family toxin [Thermococci archaeon]
MGGRRHVLLAYITSHIPFHLQETDIKLEANNPDFEVTGLHQSSIIRLHQLVTVSSIVIQRELGELPSDIQAQITEKLCHFLSERTA